MSTQPCLLAPSSPNMAEAHLPSLRTMYIAPFLGTQWVYVAIKQVVALCSQTPFKCFIAGPPEKELEPFVLVNQEATTFF